MKKVTAFEVVWYVLCGLSIVTGLTFLVLGMFGQFGGSNVVELREFSTPGYICLLAGAVCAVVVLIIFAKTNDRASEAAARRAARLGKVEAPKAETKVEPEPVVEAKVVTPVVEAKVEEPKAEEPKVEVPVVEEPKEEAPAVEETVAAPAEEPKAE